MQFLLILYTALLLKINAHSFQYSLFAINFISETASNPFSSYYLSNSNLIWSEEQVYFIFGSGPLILSAIGLRVLFVLKKSLFAGWKTKLVLTWMAFLMVNALPCGIVAGILFFDGFGMAIHWFISSYLIRGVMALMVILMLILFSRFWQRLFLNVAYNDVFLDNADNQKIFVKNVYFKPWIYGLVILLLFNWPFNNFYWPAFLLCLGAIVAIDQSLRYNAIYLPKPENRIHISRSQVLYVVMALALIWGANFLIINF